MAVKGITEHLIDEVKYSGNFKANSWHSNPGTGTLESQSVTLPSTFIAIPRRPQALIKEAVTMGLSLQAIHPNINNGMPLNNLGRQQISHRLPGGHQCHQAHPMSSSSLLRKGGLVSAPCHQAAFPHAPAGVIAAHTNLLKQAGPMCQNYTSLFFLCILYQRPRGKYHLKRRILCPLPPVAYDYENLIVVLPRGSSWIPRPEPISDPTVV